MKYNMLQGKQKVPSEEPFVKVLVTSICINKQPNVMMLLMVHLGFSCSKSPCLTQRKASGEPVKLFLIAQYGVALLALARK